LERSRRWSLMISRNLGTVERFGEVCGGSEALRER